MEEEFNLGSKELSEDLRSKYYKFSLGVPKNIEVVDQVVLKRIVEFEDKGEVKKVAKYDLKIKVDDIESFWSVSNKVLTTIQEHYTKTNKFKIILREKSYEVIPLGLKD